MFGSIEKTWSTENIYNQRGKKAWNKGRQLAEQRKMIYFQENIFYMNPKTSYFTCDKQSITWQNVHLLILNKIQKRMSARMKVKKGKWKRSGKRKIMTLDNSVQIEDAIACITSTAEQIASFRFWTSACRIMNQISHYQKPNWNKVPKMKIKRRKMAHTLAPSTIGKRSVLACKASMAPDKERE